jgi:hypothetical protein
MVDALWALAYFCLAYCIGRLQLSWLAAYHARDALRAANTDALLTALHYVPLALLIVTQNWLVIVADVAANWIASYQGVKRRD